jgi:hypothetical protein
LWPVPWRRTVSLRGTLHVEGLVGPLVILAIDEVVELGLLLHQKRRKSVPNNRENVGHGTRADPCGLPTHVKGRFLATAATVARTRSHLKLLIEATA